jgi:alpha-amylase/alpha-mannosidase (GH57 family)
MRSIVIHAHLYQPPREDPVTGAVPREPSAAPDHDWNARVTRECYEPLASIPIGGDRQDPERVGAYNFLSFNAGPTLLAWLEHAAPHVVEAMRHGDRAGLARTGHGNAVAMPYHHVILPLCSRRDQETEVRWGIADFRRVFGREPAGMWLPETAVDETTLDVLACAGIAFTVLAPHQVQGAPADGRPALVRTLSGRTIAVFAYDGRRAHDVAFGRALTDAVAWRQDLVADRSLRVISLAMDGETFGHHHKFGDLALGALIHGLVRTRGVRVENFASVLAALPAETEATLVAPTSWSCAHGVGRWREACGCRFRDGTQQAWRAPLRAAMDWLVGEVHSLYERDGAGLPDGPWAFRDAAGGSGPVTPDEAERLITVERAVLAALTSCGWFFDDIAGLEGRQVLRYAARAIALAGPDAPRLEEGFLARLDGAVSNDGRVGDARGLYLRLRRRLTR